MSLQADLDTLATLYDTLSNNVTLADTIQKDTDRDLAAAVWESPNAKDFRAAWDEFRPKLVAFEELLAAVMDVANNDIANGVTDARQLAAVSPLA